MENIAAIALSNQIVLRRQMEIIANNIANISTPGFKTQNMAFTEYVNRSNNANNSSTSYVNTFGVNPDLTQGAMQHTGGNYDLAIEGDGYFTIGGIDGTRYTRNGTFRLDSNGQLVNSNGDPVLSNNGSPIVIPSAAERVTISQNGTVYADNRSLGRLGIVTFEEPQNLLQSEASQFMVSPEKPMEPIPVEDMKIYQGMIESSNVGGVMEMTKMIQVARAYESAQRVLEKEDDRVRNTLRRLSQTQ